MTIRHSFRNDYSEGAHERILKTLAETNMMQQDGYGEDDYCMEASRLIKGKLGNDDVDIHYISGGTQANLIVISSILRPYESVIAANTGHINTHEAGAIEATGHRINAVDSADGKLTPDMVKLVLDEHTDEHMVKPGMVYISNSTEVGTVYKKDELAALYEYCRENGLYLFMDGARLGSALESRESDLEFSDMEKYTDVFYIGGTKNGALLGEAIVISNDDLKKCFRYSLKQKGALLAKGRIIGVQFLELFRDGLFEENASHANDMAFRISDAIADLGYGFIGTPSSNQIFPILPNELIEKLSEKYLFYVWSKEGEDSSSIRIVTSWATPVEAVEEFIEDIGEIKEMLR
ncbi:L-threonine aldolase [Dethiosulfatibacter aminovorans DSM 17477]|uniref:L-threonine aldolase n=1 Tax=Dethiosulfatibacter aminovorans DSM 17477 TaxID=1121476 RepID=A0A1M6I2Q6_9FIRM|nr:low specificity L-threonine aldolase [Dethiosulfatibacter aminovorans]SHJ28773.1 L-threonine aldolase [Dethiosulfatibacter aminovorans DSM 17477]